MCKKSSTFAPDFERRITLPGWRNGRRGRLKICCPQGRVGSIPTPGTKRRSFDRRSFCLNMAGNQ